MDPKVPDRKRMEGMARNGGEDNGPCSGRWLLMRDWMTTHCGAKR